VIWGIEYLSRLGAAKARYALLKLYRRTNDRCGSSVPGPSQ
jgi:hypothetical protein